MNKEFAKETFEYMYNTRMERATPDGICADLEQGELKGIVVAAFMMQVIDIDEFNKYYNEVYDKYSVVNKLYFEKIKQAK